jgi:hypothetical protein
MLTINLRKVNFQLHATRGAPIMKLLTDTIPQVLIFRSIQPIGSIFALVTDADSLIIV